MENTTSIKQQFTHNREKKKKKSEPTQSKYHSKFIKFKFLINYISLIYLLHILINQTTFISSYLYLFHLIFSTNYFIKFNTYSNNIIHHLPTLIYHLYLFIIILFIYHLYQLIYHLY